jgi:hypothetical protein
VDALKVWGSILYSLQAAISDLHLPIVSENPRPTIRLGISSTIRLGTIGDFLCTFQRGE